MRMLVAMSLLLSLGCSSVYGSAVATTAARLAPHRGPVGISATRDPPGGQELGVVEASGPTSIEEVLPEFIERAASLGGNVARIDHIETSFQWVSRPVTQTYNCGVGRFPMMCTRTYMQTEELAMLRVMGRAFRVPGP